MSTNNLRRRLTDGIPIHDPRYGTVWPRPKADGDTDALDIATVIVKAGTVSPLHFHRRTHEYYLIHSGCGEMRLGESVVQVQPGDSVCIPANTHHDIRAHTDLVLWCVSTPPYNPEDDFEIPANP